MELIKQCTIIKDLYYTIIAYANLTNLPILTKKGILSTISHYNDRVAGSKEIRIINKGLVLLVTIVLCERDGAKRRRVSCDTDQNAITATLYTYRTVSSDRTG